MRRGGGGEARRSGRRGSADGRESPSPDGVLDRVAGRVARVNGIVAVVLFAALTVVVTLQVVTRFVLHAPLIWSEEVARFLFFWVVLLGSALSVRTRRHFVLDVRGGRSGTSRGTRRLLSRVVPEVCVLGFSLLLLAQGVDYARLGLLRTATNSRVDMSLVYAAIPVFAALTVLYSAANLVRDYVALRRGERPPSRGLAAGE